MTTFNQVILDTNQLMKMHEDTGVWKSNILFIDQELNMLHKALNSYVQEPKTKERFQEVQQLKLNIKKLKNKSQQVKLFIGRFNNQLVTKIESKPDEFSRFYLEEHNDVAKKVQLYKQMFSILKTSVTKYTQKQQYELNKPIV